MCYRGTLRWVGTPRAEPRADVAPAAPGPGRSPGPLAGAPGARRRRSGEELSASSFLATSEGCALKGSGKVSVGEPKLGPCDP